MRKGVLCFGLIALLLLDSLPARAETNCFTWDLDDWERTHVSSGTGGTERREVGLAYDYWEDTPPLTDAKMIELVSDWARKVALELGNDASEDSVAEDIAFSGRFVNDALFQLQLAGSAEEDTRETGSEEEASREREFGCIRTAVFDLERQQQLKLSDLFYDDVNYIDYINQYISDRPYRTRMDPRTETLWPSAEKHSFAGLPWDYPHFSLLGNRLRIEIEAHNPFWYPYDEDDREHAIFVPLTHWVSPWGGCRVDVHYQEVQLGNGLFFRTPFLGIDGGCVPEAERAINDMLVGRSERVARDIGQAAREEARGVQPAVSYADGWGSVSLDLMSDETEFERVERTLDVVVFNLHTAEVIEPSTLVERFRDVPEAEYFKLSQGWNGVDMRLHAYRPSAWAEIIDVYPTARVGAYMVVVLRDAGATIEMRIPLRLLEGMEVDDAA